MPKIKTIGILTSGGDAPGMNAAIRAVTRAGIYNGFTIKATYRGYDGLIKGEVRQFTTENVSGIITRGGTILKTARSKEFMTPEGMQKAYETCQREEIDALQRQIYAAQAELRRKFEELPEFRDQVATVQTNSVRLRALGNERARLFQAREALQKADEKAR